MSEQINLNHVIGLIKSGEKAEARNILLNVLKTQRNNEEAWLYMAACAESKAEFESSILQVLRINPLNNQAIRLAEQHGIRLPRQVKKTRRQALKNARRSRREAAAAERRGSNRVLRLLLLVLLIVTLAGAAFLFMQQDENENPTADATEEATEEATQRATQEATDEIEATEAATEEDATAEVTEEATQEATDEIEVTQDATEESTEEATQEATEEVNVSSLQVQATPTVPPTSTPSPEPSLTPTPSTPPVLQLVYDVRTAYIKNISAENQDISELRFVQDLPNGDPVVFETTDWQEGSFSGEGSIFALQPDSCFQVGIDLGPTSTKPADCVRLSSWVTRGISSQFWLLNNASVPTFLVMRGEEVLAECAIDAGTCEFGFPE